MCIETNVLLHLPLNNFSFYAFVFGATLVQYNLHYIIKATANPGSARLAWSVHNRNIHRFFLLLGLILIIISMLSFHLRHLLLLLFIGLVAFLYSFPFLPFRGKKRIKDFGLLKIITLSLLWTLVTVWFPIVESPFAIISFQLVFLRRFIFIFILCLLFDIRDVPVDKAENINTLPVRMGMAKAYSLAYSLLFFFTMLNVVQVIRIAEYPQFWAMMISALATFFIIRKSRNNRNDLYYLAAVDGMMILQALLVLAGETYLH